MAEFRAEVRVTAGDVEMGRAEIGDPNLDKVLNALPDASLDVVKAIVARVLGGISADNAALAFEPVGLPTEETE